MRALIALLLTAGVAHAAAPAPVPAPTIQAFIKQDTTVVAENGTHSSSTVILDFYSMQACLDWRSAHGFTDYGVTLATKKADDQPTPLGTVYYVTFTTDCAAK